MKRLSAKARHEALYEISNSSNILGFRANSIEILFDDDCIYYSGSYAQKNLNSWEVGFAMTIKCNAYELLGNENDADEIRNNVDITNCYNLSLITITSKKAIRLFRKAIVNYIKYEVLGWEREEQTVEETTSEEQTATEETETENEEKKEEEEMKNTAKAMTENEAIAMNFPTVARQLKEGLSADCTMAHDSVEARTLAGIKSTGYIKHFDENIDFWHSALDDTSRICFISDDTCEMAHAFGNISILMFGIVRVTRHYTSKNGKTSERRYYFRSLCEAYDWMTNGTAYAFDYVTVERCQPCGDGIWQHNEIVCDIVEDHRKPSPQDIADPPATPLEATVACEEYGVTVTTVYGDKLCHFSPLLDIDKCRAGNTQTCIEEVANLVVNLTKNLLYTAEFEFGHYPLTWALTHGWNTKAMLLRDPNFRNPGTVIDHTHYPDCADYIVTVDIADLYALADYYLKYEAWLACEITPAVYEQTYEKIRALTEHLQDYIRR